MTILDLLQQDGDQLKRVASTHGGEYAGPCPFCGGEDRFRVWPEQDRYWCRQCRRSGDSIQYLRDTKGLTYIQACEVLQVQPKARLLPNKRRRIEPRETKAPEKTWQEKASGFLTWTQEYLWDSRGVSIRTWLKDARGLSEKTVKQAGIGWNPKDLWQDRKAWGLEDNGKKLWLPKGIVLPCWAKGNLVRLRLRRPTPENGPRYYLVPGSDTRAMILAGTSKAAVVVESELDGILLYQQARDIVTVIALGNAQARPDRDTWRLLEESEQILVCLDNDKAGVNQSLAWWKKHYLRAKWWPVPEGKDPTEAMKAGVDLRVWVMAGLDENRDTGSSTKDHVDHPAKKTIRVFSRVLNREIFVSWQGEDPQEIYADGVKYTAEEIDRIGEMPLSRDDLRAIHRVKKEFEGSTVLASVMPS